MNETEHPQYFPGRDIFCPDENEIFIDGGCLNTLTIRELKAWSNDTYKKVYAFQPAKKEKVVVDEYIEFYGYRAQSIEAGLYNENGVCSFSSDVLGLSKISDMGNDSFKVVRLDSFMKDKNERVTFIKLDIEGAKIEALEGSLEVIGRDHPKLAISIYHKFEDLWDIPLWIHEKFPEYKLYIRHYSKTNNETVLYARCDS